MEYVDYQGEKVPIIGTVWSSTGSISFYENKARKNALSGKVYKEAKKDSSQRLAGRGQRRNNGGASLSKGAEPHVQTQLELRL